MCDVKLVGGFVYLNALKKSNKKMNKMNQTNFFFFFIYIFITLMAYYNIACTSVFSLFQKA